MLFLKNAPEESLAGAIAEAEQKKTATLDKLAVMDQQTPYFNSIKNLKNAIRSQLIQKLSGFLAIYSGYMDYSDAQGLIFFPLRHANPKLYVAITPDINLIKVKGETMSHREFIMDANNPVKLYSCERKQEEIKKPGQQAQPGTTPPPQIPGIPTLPGLPGAPGAVPPVAKRFYWEIQEIAPPADKKINPLTIVLLTKPSNIYVPVGNFLAADSPHLVLPDFYVTGKVDNEEILLKAIDYGNYFEKINTEEKKSDTSMQKMISNI